MSARKVKIDSGVGLRQYLDQVFQEGIKSSLAQKALNEKEKQLAMTGGDDDGDEEEEDTSSKTIDDESEKLEKGDIKPKDIIEKLNSIRSGRSFKDSSVSSSMEEYIESLSKAEKVALMAFLKGIAQIVTGEIPAQNAQDPGDQPADVEMDKMNEPRTVHKTPNVIKGGSGSKKTASAEDTTAPTPITPKRR